MPDSTEQNFQWLRSYPDHIDWRAEIPEQLMTDIFDGAVQTYASRNALRFLGRTWTYTETGGLVDHLAKGLQDQGIGRDSKVGLCLPNTPFYIWAYYAVMKTGATVVNFNPLYAEKEIEDQIKDSGTTVMITINVPPILSKINKMTNGQTALEKIIVCDLVDVLPPFKKLALGLMNKVFTLLGRPQLAPVTTKGAHIAFNAILNNDGKPATVTLGLDDVAVFQYTSGTTGIPKAAMLTHKNLSANTHQSDIWFNDGREAGPDDPPIKMLAVLPFFHVFSMTVQMNLTLKMGGELNMLPKFNLKQLLKTIDRDKPDIFAGVPTIYRAMIDDPDIKKYDLSSLKICVSGGAALPEITKNDFQMLTGVELVEGYGLSETSPLALANPITGDKKTNSIGLPVPGTIIKIIDLKDSKQQNIGEKGEICIKGPQVMKGYWNRPDATHDIIDDDGFLHSGDVGYMDEDGYVFIVDRIKDMINASGLKVFPRKVEEALLQHPAIKEALVGGVADPYRGETVKAWIVPVPGQTVAPEDIVMFLKDRLSPYEIPKMIDIREALPKTLIGKHDRKALIKEAENQTAEQPDP